MRDVMSEAIAKIKATPVDHTACSDCGVGIGDPHEDGCDVARCLWTGRQRLMCEAGLVAECCRALIAAGRSDLAGELGDYHGLDDIDHDCGEDTWIGTWPGEADAARLGLWCRWGPPWLPCGPDHPDAIPDLNELPVKARWDRTTQTYILR